MKKNYLDLLKNPKWQKKRLKIFQRDNFRCKLCNDDKTTLNVHHKKYIKNHKPWEYNEDDLITLCDDCHNLFGTFGVIPKENYKYPILKIKNCVDNISDIIFIQKKDNGISQFVFRNNRLQYFTPTILPNIVITKIITFLNT